MSTEENNPLDWDMQEDTFYTLRLFVAGTSRVSVRAITNLKEILEQHLKGCYQLEIIDIHQQPELAQNENITAVPMLIKSLPAPKRILVGDMSDKQRVLKGLGLFNL